MKMLPRFLRRCAAAAAMAFLAISPTFAQEMVTVPTGSTVTVLKYNICRRVGNSTGSSILVPLGSPSEWIGGSSFTVHAPDFDGVSVTRCVPGGGSDASMCILHQEGDYETACSNVENEWRVVEQSSILPVSVAVDLPAWQQARVWAQNNLGAPVSARPANILPACYRDSSMTELASGNTNYYIPPDSDFCISHFYKPRVGMNSSSGPEYTANWTAYYRLWRP